MPDMPDTIMAWDAGPYLPHLGTWAITRYPVEAVKYIRAEAAEAEFRNRELTRNPDLTEEPDRMSNDERALMRAAANCIRRLRAQNAELATKAQAYDALVATIFHTRLPSQGMEPDIAWQLDVAADPPQPRNLDDDHAATSEGP